MSLNQNDIDQILEHGLSLEDVEKQLQLFRNGVQPLPLVRAATIGDGILKLNEKEKEVYAEQMANSGKPAQVVEKIVEGKLDKWYSEVCLLEQAFVKNPDVTIQALLTERIASLGENIKVRRFSRLEVGAE